jgi:hypothetical protein
VARVMATEEADAFAGELNTRLTGEDTPEEIATFILSKKEELEK